MSRTYVTEVTTNVKRGCEAVKLGPKTLIIGPNGAGKTTVVNAIELALTGSVADLMNKDEVKSAQVLAQLAPYRGTSAFAKATLSDGTTCSWTLERTKKTVKKPVHTAPGVNPENVFPLRQVLAELTASDARAKKFLLSKVEAAYSWEDVQKRIVDLEARKRLDLITAGLDTGNAAATLTKALELAQERAKAGTAAVNGANEALNTQLATLAPAPTALEFAAAEKALADAKANLRGLSEALTRAQALKEGVANAAFVEEQRVTLAKRIAELEPVVMQLRTRHAEWKQALAEATQALAGLEAPKGGSPAIREAAFLVLEAGASANWTTCPLCTTSPVNLRPAYMTAKAKREERAAAGKAYHEAEARVAACQKTLDEITTKGKALGTELKTAQAAFASLPPAPEIGLEIPSASISFEAIEAAEQAERAAQDTLTRMQADKESWEKASAMASTAGVNLQMESAAWSALAIMLTAAVDAFSKAGSTGYTTKVQQFLPPELHYQLRASEDGVEYGVIGRGPEGYFLQTALSGSEGVIVHAAMAAAIAPAHGPAVVVFKDCGMTPETTSAVLEALSASQHDVQFILTSVVEPARPVPSDWTVVRRGV